MNDEAELAQIEEYEHLIGSEAIERIMEKAKPLQDLHICHVNSTYYGGGVSVLLSSLTLLMNSLGNQDRMESNTGLSGFLQH